MLGDNRSACWLIWNFHNIHKWCGHKPIIRGRQPARLMCDNAHRGRLHPQSLLTYYSPSRSANWWTGEKQFTAFFGDCTLLGDFWFFVVHSTTLSVTQNSMTSKFSMIGEWLRGKYLNEFGRGVIELLKGKGKGKGKGKAIPLQAWTGPEGSRRLRFPDFKTIGTRMW